MPGLHEQLEPTSSMGDGEHLWLEDVIGTLWRQSWLASLLLLLAARTAGADPNHRIVLFWSKVATNIFRFLVMCILIPLKDTLKAVPSFSIYHGSCCMITFAQGHGSNMLYSL